MREISILSAVLVALMMGWGVVYAGYFPYNTSSPVGNVGIGTSLAKGGLVVMNGNVGIGTWIPSQLLDVNGTIKAAAFSGDGSAVTGTTTNGWSISGSNIYITTGSNNVGIGSAAPQGGLIVTNGNVGIGSNIANSRLTITGDGASTLFRVDDSGPNDPSPFVITSTGNVGIGTIAEAAIFEVAMYGGTPSTDKFKIPVKITKVADGGGTDFPAVRITCSGGSCDYTNPATNTGVLRIENFWADTSRMIDSQDNFVVYGNGNVGIGTSMPVGKLTVNGNVGIGTGGSNFLSTVPPNGGLIVQGNTGLGTVTPQTQLAVLGNVGIGTWTATSALIVRGGNVGIGTFLAPAVLSVKGSFAGTPIVLTDAATIATDASLGNHFRVTLGGNRTLGNPTNGVDGQRVMWEFIQDATGSRTLTLGSSFGLGSDVSSVTLTTAANKRDFLSAVYNVGIGSWYVVGFVKGY